MLVRMLKWNPKELHPAQQFEKTFNKHCLLAKCKNKAFFNL
jgi:hypothetical protein